jgi:hypothetical protein
VDGAAGPYQDSDRPGAPEPTVLLVCPQDFGQRPTAAALDVRRELAATRRQLARLTRIEELLDALPPGTTFDLAPDDAGLPTRPAAELARAVDSVPAAYGPECLSACELGFHCRAQARDTGELTQLGRGVRADFGELRTVDEALCAAETTGATGATRNSIDSADDNPAGPDAATERLRRAARLRAEALAGARTDPTAGPPAAAPAEPLTGAAR